MKPSREILKDIVNEEEDRLKYNIDRFLRARRSEIFLSLLPEIKPLLKECYEQCQETYRFVLFNGRRANYYITKGKLRFFDMKYNIHVMPDELIEYINNLNKQSNEDK